MGYSRLGQRRRGSGAWQWMLLGFLPGLLCGGLLIFLLFALDVLEGFRPEPEVIEVTSVQQIVQVISPTPDPEQTEAVRVVTATPQPTEEAGEGVVVVSSPTPTVDPTIAAASTETPTPPPDSPADVESTLAGDVPQPTVAAAAQATPTSAVPQQLAQIASVLVDVPGGVFEMGTTNQEIIDAANECVTEHGGQCNAADGEDSTPLVRVELDSFQIEQTEVTFEQYVAFLNYLAQQGVRHTNGCSGFICIQTTNENPTNAVIIFDGANYTVSPGLLNHPVYGVTWYGAEAYCRTLGRRLPTEAEWEYAARGGDRRVYPWGNDWSQTNANTRLPLDGEPGTRPVTDYAAAANPYGLLNMAGNVAEWVSDWYSPDYYSQIAAQPQPVTDPQGAVTGTLKVLRGGSWNTMPFFARTVHRQAFAPFPEPINADYPRWVGFRCAADGSVAAAGSVDPATLGQTTTEATPLSDSAPPESEQTDSTSPRG